MLTITTASETHRSLNKDAPVSRPVQRTGVIRSRASWADFITTIVGFKVFGTHKGAQTQISELARSGFHFAGLTESMSKSNMRSCAPAARGGPSCTIGISCRLKFPDWRIRPENFQTRLLRAIVYALRFPIPKLEVNREDRYPRSATKVFCAKGG